MKRRYKIIFYMEAYCARCGRRGAFDLFGDMYCQGCIQVLKENVRQSTVLEPAKEEVA